MISEEEARRGILDAIVPLPARRVSLGEVLNCFAAQDYFAKISLPGFDNSAMDGYAVIANSCQPGKPLRVVGEQPAGVDRKLRVAPGEAVRIFTGAPIPAGADAIVMQEDVTRDGDRIVVNERVGQGDFIRRKGCDLAEGQKILAAGERILPTIAALLASQGLSEVVIGGEVSAAVISTGDELAKPGEKLQPGQIYDSNSVLIDSLLKQTGVAKRLIEHCGDQRESLTAAFQRGVKHDVMIICGGVSVGEHDLVKSVLQAIGGKIEMWRVSIKPGTPFLFGMVETCRVFGLPGNPVSAFITFRQFVRPAILKMMGASDNALQPSRVPARLAIDLRNDGDRPHYVRGKLQNGTFSPIGRQESHALFGLRQADALFRLPAGIEIKSGSMIEVERLD